MYIIYIYIYETRFWSIFWTYHKPGYQFQKSRPPNMPTAARLTSCCCLLLCTHTQLTALQQNICSFYMNLCTVYNYNYYYNIPYIYISSSLVQSVESTPKQKAIFYHENSQRLSTFGTPNRWTPRWASFLQRCQSPNASLAWHGRTYPMVSITTI